MTSGLKRQLYLSLLLLSVVCGNPPFDSCTDILSRNSGEYLFRNDNGQTYTAYCEFQGCHVYMFIPATTSVPIDIARIGPYTTKVCVKHRRSNGNQYDTIMEQLSSYSNVSLSVQYNTYIDYRAPANRATLGPFMYLGMLPGSVANQMTTQGYRANGQDFTFNNCDGNGNSYLAFYFDPNSGTPTRIDSGYSTLMRNWIDVGTPVNISLPDDYFFPTCEMHMGGCGGFALTGHDSLADISGAVMGLYLDVNECDSNPCQNDATCNNLHDNYSCICADGWKGYNCEQADVTVDCYPNNTISVYYLPPGANCYAMQNTTGTDVQCNITTIDSRTVKMTGCSKDLPILLSFGSYADMDTHNLHAGRSLTTFIIKCNEIPDTGNYHSINNTLAASLQIDEETDIDPDYDVTSSLNITSTVVGNAVAWTISFPAEYILEVSSCTAYAGTDDSSSLSVTLISSGGCNAAEELISDFVDNMDGSATAIIHAFKFYDEESVFLQCTVTICPDIAGQSCDTSCSRTKRAIRPTASGEPVSRYQRSVQNILRVVEPNYMYSGTVVNVPAFTDGVSLIMTLPFVFILP